MWRIHVANANVHIKTAKQIWFQCGASSAATALLAEAFVAGIVITMLPSTSVPICCTTWSMAHGRSMAMLITTNPVGLVLPVNANRHEQILLLPKR